MAHYLDRESVYQELDSERVLLSLGSVPDQILQAWHEVGAMKLRLFRPSCVVVSGMGGSGLGPDIFRTAFGTRVRVPFIISNGYSLPGYVNARSYVISVSYSGGTEETVAAYKEASLRGAKRFVVTTGGTLLRQRTTYPVTGLNRGIIRAVSRAWDWGMHWERLRHW